MTTSGSRRQRGQAITEVALLTPLVILLLLGAYDVSIYGSNQVQAMTAVRNGARIGALLGGKGGANQATCKGAIKASYNPADTDTAPLSPDADGAQDAVDQQIVQTVLAGTKNMNYITIQEIDIYSPSAAGGKFTASPANGTAGSGNGDLIDYYDGTGKEMKTGSPTPSDIQTFTLDKRCQGPLGSETELGVQIIWTYKPANGVVGRTFGPITDWAVEKLAFCDSQCHT
jgi:hypothetical protein